MIEYGAESAAIDDNIGGLLMGLIKCPRCELNYMLDTDKLCTVCRREVRGEAEQYETIELCSECGENPVVPGQELCAYCLKERSQNTEDDQDENVNAAASIGIDSVSTMDEIEIGIDDDMDDEIPNEEFKDDAKGFFGDDDEGDDDDGDDNDEYGEYEE